MLRKAVVLFLSSRGNNLQLMAEAIVGRTGGEAVSVVSASMGPAVLQPEAVQAMREIGMSIEDIPLRTPLDVDVFNFDLVITLGDFDQSCRPSLPAMPPHLHWTLPDPTGSIADEALLDALREARGTLQRNAAVLVSCGILPALATTRWNFERVLDALGEGIVAQTTGRRVFYFNQAAERITGLSRDDVLGRDWHDVLAQSGVPSLRAPEHGGLVDDEAPRGEVVFRRPDGSERILELASAPLRDPDGGRIGTLDSFKDNTSVHLLRSRAKRFHVLGNLVGKDPETLLLFDLIREVASVDVPVLIQGESGTGKELVANAIHELSPRKGRPFVAVNCAALPEGILESELFGHVRGAFSGAVQSKRGRFELADGGTILLDEIAELSPRMQVKLLRVLQEQRFERVGGEETIQVDVRIVSATNQDLDRMMDRDQFRRDLYYRLCVIPITVPALRDRRMDIPILVEHFVELVAKRMSRPVLLPTPEALAALTHYAWPGNVRELKNALEFAYVKCRGGFIGPQHLPAAIGGGNGRRDSRPLWSPKVTKAGIEDALARAGGDKKRAARLLGIGRATLYRYLELYGLS